MKRLILLLTALTGMALADGEIAGILFSCSTDGEPQQVLPLKRTDVETDVTAGIAQTRVTQRFHNDLGHPLEAVYIFPLPSEAACTDFEIRLDDRVIRSEVKKRAEAKQIYKQAKAEGKKTALMEQERPNIFTTSVANLLPGETVDICFTYVETLRFQKDRYDITFPMVVGERYIPFTFTPQGKIQPAVANADRQNPPVLPPLIDPEHRLSIHIQLHGLPIETITSSTHAIRVDSPDTDTVTVELTNNVCIPDCEFNIAVHLKKSDIPTASFVKSGNGTETYGLFSVLPPIGEQKMHKTLPKDVVFLIDTSGSMSGESMAQAKSGLKRCLNILGPDDRFTVVRFASDFSWFSPALRNATPDKLDAAVEYIAGLDADGGTEMQPALEYALNIPRTAGRMPMVLFLTDGDVGDEGDLIRLLSQKLGNARLFTFGIGSAPNEFLMHRMAQAGRGQSRFIRSHEDIGKVMAGFFQTLKNPVLTDISVHWANDSVHCYPERCPDIFYGRPLQLAVHAASPLSGPVHITGTLDGEAVEYTVDLDEQRTALHPAIRQLYGREEIKDLMVRMMQTEIPEARAELKQRIIEVALKHRLVSKYTSRIAVEERVSVETGDLVSVNVPVPSPKGWQLHATATQDPARLLLGLIAILCAGVLWKITHAIAS